MKLLYLLIREILKTSRKEDWNTSLNIVIDVPILSYLLSSGMALTVKFELLPTVFIMSFAKDYEVMTADYANLKQRVAALHGLYAEVLETVTRIYDEL